MVEIKACISGINIDVKFEDKVNVLFGNSGEGKTFLFDLLSDYCILNHISYICIDYKYIGREDGIVNACAGCSIVALDNADLYLTPLLLNRLKQLDCIIIMSRKSLWQVNPDGLGVYKVHYDGISMKVRKWGMA